MALSHEDVGHKINTKCTLMFIKHFENNGKPCDKYILNLPLFIKFFQHNGKPLKVM